MSLNFDKVVTKLNNAVMEQMRQNYSDKVFKLIMDPKNMGRIEDADGYGKIKGPCGDTMEIFLEIQDDLILNARFTTIGCGATIVCGSMVSELAKGSKIEKALLINAQKVLEELDGLPEANHHCAKLATNTLHKSITNYLDAKREPGKKTNL